MFDKETVLSYARSLPESDSYKDKSDEDLTTLLFDAYEDIYSLYPNINISDRMIAKQMIYKLEATQSGFGVYHKQGLKSRSINDASITFKDSDYNMFDPYVWRMIDAQLGRTRGMFGTLV